MRRRPRPRRGAKFVAYSYQLVAAQGSATESWTWPEFGVIHQVEGMARVDFKRTGPARGMRSIGFITKTGGLTAFSLNPAFRENGSYLECLSGTTCESRTCSGHERHIDSGELDFHKSIHSNTVKVVFSMPLPEENSHCPAIPGTVPQSRMTKSYSFSLFKGTGHDQRVTFSLEGSYTYLSAGLAGGHSTFDWTYEVTLKRV